MSGAEAAQDKDKGKYDPEVVFVDTRNVQCPVAGQEVFEYLKSSTDHGLMLDEDSGMFEKISEQEKVFYDFKCLSTDKELHSHDTGLLAMLHSWYITNIELSSSIEYDF